MATLDAAPATGGYILPRPATPRRNLTRRRPAAVPRGAVIRRRGARPDSGRLSGERVDTLILQGGIVLAMTGMVLYFHAPLLDAVRALI